MSEPQNRKSASKLNSPDCTPSELDQFLELSRRAAQSAGELLISWLGRISVSEKNPGDYVTQADIESQQTIQKLIFAQFPEHGFLGEESVDSDDTSGSLEKEFCWIVDPLDGTTNYIHQMHSWAVSIALKKNDRIIAATVHDPILKETYSAVVGGGATLNNRPIRVSSCQSPDDALLVCSFPGRNREDSPAVRRFLNVMCHTGASVRRLGSAALNLCYVAQGRLDGYWATSIKIWDVAAGALILEEAGGVIRHIDDSPFDLSDPQLLATSTSELHSQLSPHLRVNDSATT